jgi:hypothetical protein
MNQDNTPTPAIKDWKETTPISDFKWTDELVKQFVAGRIIAPHDYLHIQLNDRISSFKAKHSAFDLGEIKNPGERRWWLRLTNSTHSEPYGSIGYYAEDLIGRSETGAYRWFFSKESAEHYWNLHVNPKPEPVFRTMDDKQLFPGEKAYGISDLDPDNIREETMPFSDYRAAVGRRWYSSRELAVDSVIMNKPVLSINDIITISKPHGSNAEIRWLELPFKHLKSLAQSKIKGE